MSWHINAMTQSDIDSIMATFSSNYWRKERTHYERYWAEQQRNERVVFVATSDHTMVGYVTLVWTPGYEHFRAQDIPEIVDLNVDPPYRKQGIGTALIKQCEHTAREHGHSIIGISVVEDDPAYAAAYRLYPTLGYVPDGHGIDHENELHLTKSLLP